jgi:hypothetical protein
MPVDVQTLYWAGGGGAVTDRRAKWSVMTDTTFFAGMREYFEVSIFPSSAPHTSGRDTKMSGIVSGSFRVIGQSKELN